MSGLSGFNWTSDSFLPLSFVRFFFVLFILGGWLRDYWSLGKRMTFDPQERSKIFINAGVLLGNPFFLSWPAFSCESGISRLASQRRTLAFVHRLPVAMAPGRWRRTWLSTFCTLINRSFCLFLCAGRSTTQNSRRLVKSVWKTSIRCHTARFREAARHGSVPLLSVTAQNTV